MKEDLLEYYQNNISIEALVFTKMHKLSVLLKSVMILFGILVLITTFFSNTDFIFILIILDIISVGLIFITLLKHVNKSASIVRDEYENAVIGTAWNNKEFRGMQQRLLKRYLEVNGLFYKEKIKILISSLKSETDNFKLTPAIVQTAIVTLFVANVTQFLNVLYNAHKEFAFLIFAVVVFLIVLISIVLLMIPYNSDDIKSIIFKKLYLKKDIIDKLEDMLLIYFE